MTQLHSKLDSILPEINIGYADVRLERNHKESFEVQNECLTNHLRVSSEGHLLRVAGDIGFNSILGTDQPTIRETDFSKYVKDQQARQEDSPMGALGELPNVSLGDSSLLRKTVLELSRPPFSFSFLSDQRSILWANTQGRKLFRHEILRVIKIMATIQARSGAIALRRYVQNPVEQILHQTVSEMDVTLHSLKDSVPVEPGQYDIILHPSCSSVLIHELFGHFCETDRLPPFANMPYGIQVGKRELHVEDVPQDPGGVVDLPFDDEGISSRRVTLIENGLFKESLHSLETAFRTKIASNGRARARDFRYLPQARMTNIRILGGNVSSEELFSRVKKGYYLIGSLGGVEGGGSFQIYCQYGYRIEGGRLTQPVFRPTLGGDKMEVLKNIVGIGNDLTWVMDGGCLAEEQFLVGSGRGAPHVWIKNAKIT